MYYYYLITIRSIITACVLFLLLLLITVNLLLLMIINIIINICSFTDFIIINIYFRSTSIINLIMYSICSYQTECLQHQKCSVGPQRQTGKASRSAGLQLQPNDAAIYTGSHSLDTHLQMEKSTSTRLHVTFHFSMQMTNLQ